MVKQIKHYIPFIIIGVLLILLCFKQCNSVVKDYLTTEQNNALKAINVILTKKEDSTKKEVKKTDSVRTKYVIKWRTKLHDTTIYKPCEELILICDSIIVVDSTEISQLRQVILYSDSIIVNQKVIIHNDSLDITCLKNSVKKQRRQKNLALLGLGVLGGVLIIK